MPNFCYNLIHVHGELHDLHKLLFKLDPSLQADAQKSLLKKSMFSELPSDLIPCITQFFTTERGNFFYGFEHVFFDELLPVPDNITYDAMFGTRSNPWDTSEWKIINFENKFRAQVTYITAWSPATTFYQRLTKSPRFKVRQYYGDECGNFIGYNMIHQGDIVTEVDLEWDSEEAFNVRQKLGMEEADEDGALPVRFI